MKKSKAKRLDYIYTKEDLLKFEKRISFKSLFVRSITTLVAIITSEFTALEIYQTLSGENGIFSKAINNYIVFFGIAIAFLLLYLLFFVYSTCKSHIECCSYLHNVNSSTPTDSIIDVLDDAYKKERYTEVVKIGKQLSKPLWYTGKYELRLRIGYMLEAAAAQCENYEVQAETLLEDCGWTNIRLGNKKEGIANIKRGLEIAEHIKSYSLVAQGYRNLIDIHLGEASNNLNLRYIQSRRTAIASDREQELQKCKVYYDKAVIAANLIEDATKKKELLGNISYTISKYYLVTGDYKKALEEVMNAWGYYQSVSNEDKIIKLYSLKGVILRYLGKEEEAISIFQEGLAKSKSCGNNIHIVSNCLSLCEAYIDMNNITMASRMLEQAYKYSTAITDPHLESRILEIRKELEE